MKRCLLALSLLILIGSIMPKPIAADNERINLNTVMNPLHEDVFRSTDRELLVYGGAGAGKSYTIADKLFLQGILNPGEKQKIVVVRKTLASIRKSTLDIIERRAAALQRPFILDRSSWTARCGNQTWIFTGMNNREDYQKVKSLTDVNFIWINELTELREDDYRELLLRLRGGLGTSRFSFRQIIGDFNPIGKTSWIYDRFWTRLASSAEKLRYTVLDNPWAEPEYVDRLKQAAADNPNFHRVYFLGEWGELEGVIFNWDVVPLPAIAFDEIIYGGDFGYSVDPSALVKIYRRADEFWIEELLYQTGLTNPALAEAALRLGVPPRAESYWDSAEPKSIQELKNCGLNAKPSLKGPDSVRASIDFLLSLKIHIVEGSPNLSKEVRSYVRKMDKDGNFLPEPIEHDDHAIKAAIYGIYTHMKRTIGGLGIIKTNVNPD